MVATKVWADKSGGRLFTIVRRHHEEVKGRRAGGTEGDSDFLKSGFPAEKVLVLALHPGEEFRRSRRHFSVHKVLEEFLQFAPAFHPKLLVSYRFPLGRYQRIWPSGLARQL